VTPPPVFKGYDEGIARLPKWIFWLGLLGAPVAGRWYGVPAALGFLLGAGCAYLNFRLIERFADRLGQLATGDPASARATRGGGLFFQFLGLVAGAVVILKVSQLNVVAAMCGFLVCPAAVLLEILYELLTYGHS